MWDEEQATILFDTFTKDYGNDGIPGDLHEDKSGNGTYDPGEPLYSNGIHEDVGLDGILCLDINGDGFYDTSEGDIPPDEGEGDGYWDPGDAWEDDGDGIINKETDEYNFDLNADNWNQANDDIWPIANGIWDYGEDILGDCGQDGLCPGSDDYPGPDPGEGDGILEPIDANELDGNYDTGDGCFGCDGDIDDERLEVF